MDSSNCYNMSDMDISKMDASVTLTAIFEDEEAGTIGTI